MAFWNRLQSVLFGGAIGAAAADAVRPQLEPIRQGAWRKNQVRVLEPGTAADAAARHVISEADARSDAAANGIGATRADALIALAQTFPGLADLDKLSNREILGREQVQEILARLGYRADLHQPLIDLMQDLLSVADVAAAVQQGHLPNPGILPDVSAAVTPAQGSVTPEAPDQQPPSEVPLTQIDLDPVKEAAGSGFDLERLKVRANLAGLPPGPAELLAMWNRNEITETAVDAGLREGHLKTKWSAAYKRMRWAVLGASEYANAYIRGWVTKEAMYKGGALTGHTTDQMDLLWRNRGRPIAPVQAFTAIARGAPKPHELDEPATGEPFDWGDFGDAIRRSDVQTRYIATLQGIFHAYPPLFQLGRLAQAKALSEERVRTILKYERYEQQDIDALVEFWYRGPAGAAGTTPATKAEGQLWTAAHRSYVGEMSGVQAAQGVFAALGIPAAQQTAILALWDQERDLIRKQLTPAQIKKAVKEQVTNPATNAPWSEIDAQQALMDRGYSAQDALTFLAE